MIQATTMKAAPRHSAAPRYSAARTVPWPLTTIACVCLSGGVRLAYLASNRVSFNADEAVTGIMVRDILRGKHYAFYAGQNYGGTVEQYLQALVYLALPIPENAFTLRLTQVGLSMTTCALIYQCGRLMFPSRAQALLAALVYAISPWFNIVATSTSQGFYVAGQTISVAALYCALKVRTHSVIRQYWVLGFGLMLGLGLWTTITTAYLLIPLLLWVSASLGRGWLNWLSLLGAGILGSLPMLHFMFTSSSLPLPPDNNPPTSVSDRLGNLAGPVLREYLGVSYIHDEGGLPRGLQFAVVAVSISIFIVALWRCRGSILATATFRTSASTPVGVLLLVPFIVIVYTLLLPVLGTPVHPATC